MKQLVLTREQYVSLYNEIKEEHELKFAEDGEYKEEMELFLLQLDEAINTGDGTALFDLDIDVADAIASENYEVSHIFSKFYQDNITQLNR